MSLYRNNDDKTYVGEASSRKTNAQRQARLTERVAGATGRLLDIGCSAGYFLAAAQERGFEVMGLEVSQPLAAFAQKEGHAVTCSPLEEATFEAQRFDVITLWDVLEHLHDPACCLKRIFDWLAPGGYVLVNVPASDSVVARLFGRRWPLLLPEHLHYFSREALRGLFERAGYVPGSFHPHPVTFTTSYVTHRLKQHQIPGARLADWLIQSGQLGKIPVPLLMGEVTAVARKI